MAPPPAAPGQPPQLDFQTDPNQRQRFKQFMQQRMQPPMPQMPAPMPQPMPTVPAGSYILPDMDIFAPQQFYDGGIVGGLNSLGEMSGQMVEALNQVVYGGDPMGGGMPSAPSGPPSMGGGGFGGGNMPPPLPPVDTSVYQPGGSTDSSGPVASIGSGVPTAQPYNHVGASAINTSDMYGGIPGADNSMTMGTGLASTVAPSPDGLNPGILSSVSSTPVPQDVRSAYDAAVKSAQEQRKNGFMGRVMLPGEMGFDRFAEGYNYRLNNPNLQPLTSVGNDGFGSISQGPLDFLDGSNIAQPTLGGNVGGDKLMGVLPNGGVTSGQQSPQDLLRQAQSRMMQQDVKSPELQAYLDNVIQTGGNPTISEPQTNYLSLGTLPSGFTPLPPGELGFTENMMGPIQGYAGGSATFDESAPYQFADGGSVADALADALSNDIGDYSADDTMTDLSQTSYNDFDPGGNESFDAAAMDQFRNQQVSDLSSTIGQQIQNALTANQQMGTPAPVPQSKIEQMQFENLQNVPTTEPVFSMPSLNLGGKSTSFDLLGNPLTIGFEDGGSVPPRETDIRGMHHELSYITPDEADILMALGGTGEAGPMGIPSYRPGGDDVGSENAGSGDHSGGPGSASSADSSNASDDEMGDVGIMDGPGYSGPDDTDSVEVAQDQQDMGFGIFDSVDDFNDVNLSKPGTLGQSYDMNAINRNRQERMNRQEILDNIEENEIETGKVSTGTAVNDGDIESLDGLTTSLTNAIESSSKTGEKKGGYLGLDDMLALDRNKYSKDVTTDPMAVARAMDSVQPKGLMDIGIVSNAMKGLAQLTGQYPSDEQIAKDYANRQFGMGVSPGEAIAALGMDKGIKAAGMVGMTPDGQYVDITGDALANAFGPENRTKDDGILSGITGFFNDQLFDAASGSKVAVVDSAAPELANIVGSTTGFGAYTGDNRFDPNRPPEDFGGGGDDNILLPLKPEEVAPESTDPNQIGGINTPADPLAPAGPVLVPSTRTSTPFSGQMPVGYGTPQTGQINPYALAEMRRYEQLLRQFGQQKSPIGLAQGGSVLDAAAGRFLESLTAA